MDGSEIAKKVACSVLIAQGAETPVWLAAADDPLAKSSGKYFYDCKCAARFPVANAYALGTAAILSTVILLARSPKAPPSLMIICACCCRPPHRELESSSASRDPTIAKLLWDTIEKQAPA